MSIVDLVKARIYADVLVSGSIDETAADWIHTLAGEVELQTLAAEKARRSEQAALADAARLTEENDLLRTALLELLHQVGELIKGLTP